MKHLLRAIGSWFKKKDTSSQDSDDTTVLTVYLVLFVIFVLLFIFFPSSGREMHDHESTCYSPYGEGC